MLTLFPCAFVDDVETDLVMVPPPAALPHRFPLDRDVVGSVATDEQLVVLALVLRWARNVSEMHA